MIRLVAGSDPTRLSGVLFYGSDALPDTSKAPMTLGGRDPQLHICRIAEAQCCVMTGTAAIHSGGDAR